ncbi:hypothetical protein CSOJ01_08464 [Colletotrichum sojae]|uniref:Uncharacterized protein n=1 Tax=Colletotrichum sojae TaxID=2175907 RepID=A0A8H6J6K1_9PEZI|nr:hypothetical protein CSOJ01_08464 [Colletotrichum sojae]
MSTDNGVAVALNFIRHGGATTPPSIRKDYDYVVLPRITLQNAPASERHFRRAYSTTVLRPTFECSTLQQDDILLTEILRVGLNLPGGSLESQVDGEISTRVYTTMTLNGTLPYNSSSKKYNFTGITPNSQFLGKKPASPGGYDSWEIFTQGIEEKLEDSGTYNLTGFFCSQGIEEIPATITYQGDPGYNNLEDIKLHSNETRPWWNETNGEITLAFHLRQFFQKSFTIVSSPYGARLPSDFEVDKFFEHLLTSSGRNISAGFTGSENAERLKHAVVQNYKESMAHVIDLNFRSADAVTIEGVTSQHITRISIHRTSKLILQCLLSTMAILGLVGYKLVKLRGTLHRNPCSIASTMGFLADSHLCDPDSGILPKDAADMSENELRRCLQEYVFSLGWWDALGDRRKMTHAIAEDGIAVGSESEPEAAGTGEDTLVEDEGVLETEQRGRFGIEVGQADVLGFCGKSQAGKRLD